MKKVSLMDAMFSVMMEIISFKFNGIWCHVIVEKHDEPDGMLLTCINCVLYISIVCTVGSVN